jgi:tetratricopeptide (TPR) repeat protein
MRLLFSLLLLLMLLMLITAGCRSSKKMGSSAAASKQKVLSSEEQRQAEYLFFNAIKEKSTGNYDKALELFNQVIRIDMNNDAAYYEIAQIYYRKRKFQDALHFARTAATMKPSNEWYQLLLADVCAHAGRLTDAISIHEKLARTYPSRVEYFFNWANALLFAGKVEEAIRVLDQAEQKIGIERDLIVQKKNLYLRLGKIDKAAAEIEKLISANPTDMGAYSLLVELYQANRLSEKVLETVERMKKINPTSPHIYLALAEYYRSIKENEKSFEQLKLAFLSVELDSDVKLRILSSYFPIAHFNESLLQQALELADIFTEAHPSEAIGHAIYGDFLNLAKKNEEAVVQYRLSLDLDNKNEQVWQQYLINLSTLELTDRLLNESEEALLLFPNNPVFYLLNGIAKFDRKRFREAADMLVAGSKLVVDNNSLLVDFYSRLGDTYHELAMHEESDRYYEKALALDPKNPYVLNNYSYYLSLRKEKLERAESMSRLSNELMPGQSSFLDTYAWVMYQMKRYNEALQWIEKAIEAGGHTNGTILEHYGDILYHLNRQEEALQQWIKAREAGGGSQWLEKKIADKKLYE